MSDGVHRDSSPETGEAATAGATPKPVTSEQSEVLARHGQGVCASLGELWHCHPPLGDDRVEDRHRWLVIRSVPDIPISLETPLDVPGCIVYSTSRETPEVNAMPVVAVPSGSRRLGRGLNRPLTRFVGTRVTYVFQQSMQARVGRLSRAETAQVQTMVVRSLGLGTGSARVARSVSNLRSIRGLLVRLAPRMAQVLCAPYAIIVTAHALSAAQYYQLVVPVWPREPETATHPSLDVIVEEAWVGRTMNGTTCVVVGTRFLASIMHSKDLAPAAQQPRFIVPEATLHRIETGLREFVASAGEDAGPASGPTR